MPELQPPFDDRHRGLKERSASSFTPARAPASTVVLPNDRPVDSRSDPDAEAMAAQLEIACRYGAAVERVAARLGLLPSVIAGFCSRRSRWGLALSPVGVDGTRDLEPRAVVTDIRQTPRPPDGLGFERGLMALDYDRHALAREQHWHEPERNIEAAVAVVAAHSTHLRRRTTLQGTGLLRAAFSAFECGLEAVERAIRLGLDVDSAAHGCGRDVLARAQFFQAEGWD